MSLHYIIYLLIMTVAVVAGLLPVKKRLLPVVVILVITICSEVLSNYLAHAIRNNNIGYHFYLPLQAMAWGWFFYLNMDKRFHSGIVVSLAALVLFSVLNTILWQGLWTFPGNFAKFECLFLLFFAVHQFIDFLDRPSWENILGDSVFVICIAIIWFNLISFIFYVLFNLFLHFRIPTDTIRAVLVFANYIYYSLLLFAMFLKTKTKPYGRQ